MERYGCVLLDQITKITNTLKGYILTQPTTGTSKKFHWVRCGTTLEINTRFLKTRLQIYSIN